MSTVDQEDYMAKIQSGCQDLLKYLETEFQEETGTSEPVHASDQEEEFDIIASFRQEVQGEDEKMMGLLSEIEKTQSSFSKRFAAIQSELSPSDFIAISPKQLPMSPPRSVQSPYPTFRPVETSPSNYSSRGPSTEYQSERSVFVRDGSCETQISMNDLSSRHMSQLEALSKQEQCTFRPEIHELPEMYQRRTQRRAVPFLERQEKWRRRVELDRKFLEEELIESELEECTFTPKITSPIDNCPVRVVDPTQQAKVARELLAERRKQQEDEEFKKHCTFRPQIDPRSREIVKQSREMPVFSVRNSGPDEDAQMRDCTFKPKLISKYSPESEEVRNYSGQDIFERLYNQNHIFNKSRWDESSQSQTKRKRKAGNIDDFLEQLMKQQEAKEERIKEIEAMRMRELGATFKPKLSKRSQKMVEKRGQSFETRLIESMKESEARLEQAQEFPFKPKLSKGTKKILRKRSPNELVRRVYTDANKKKYEQSLTLKPKTNKPKVTKKLNAYLKKPAHARLSENTDTFHKTRSPEKSAKLTKSPKKETWAKKKKKLPEDALEEVFKSQYKYAQYYGERKSKLKEERRIQLEKEETRLFKPNFEQLANNSSHLKIKEHPLTKFKEDLAHDEPFKKADELEQAVREKLNNLNSLIQENSDLQEALKSPTKVHQSYYVRELKRQQNILDEARKCLNLDLDAVLAEKEEIQENDSPTANSPQADDFDSLMQLMEG